MKTALGNVPILINVGQALSCPVSSHRGAAINPIQETCLEVSDKEVEVRFEPRQEGSGVQACNYQVIFFSYTFPFYADKV